MSIAALAYAFGLLLASSDKWVLVCLADYADDWGDSIFPTLDTLAEKTGMSDDTVKRALRRLIKAGIVERLAASTPVSPAFYRIVGIPEPKKFEKEPSCPASLRRAVIYLFEARCEYCFRLGTKELGPDERPWAIDRVVPGKRGGIYSPDNVTLSCRLCSAKRRSNDAPVSTRTLAAVQAAGSPQIAPSPEGGKLPDWEGGKTTPSEGGTVHPDPLLDPGSDPSSERTGAVPRHAKKVEATPDGSLAVITRLAHETFDVLGMKADAVELTETLKSRCARLRVPYDSAVVRKALDSARWQRNNPSSPEVH